ncbi:MAG: AbrB/MazE/SpoVT family DNA-binding domain-containing protein [Defluviitaleaceae bacterium]|nr:AbrB/MazE/SpoVT family DNA-binding domain-containing protein [Defluviitaleaceae bacterium]
MNHTRKIYELGRVILPIKIRKALSIKEGDDLNISIEDNVVILQKRTQDCIICHGIDDMQIYNDKNVCGVCYGKLAEHK